MRTGRIVKAILAAAFVLPMALFAEVVYLNDNFNDGDRTNQNLPGSAAWFATHTANVVEMRDKGDGNWVAGVAVDNAGGTTRGLVGYFTDNSSSKVTLTAGGTNSTLSYSFDLTPTSASMGDLDHAMRFIIANGPATRLATDGLGDAIMSGYMISLNPNTGAMTFRRRDETAGNYLSTITRWVNMDSSQSLFGLTGEAAHTMTIDIERLLDDTVKLTATLTDGTLTQSVSYIDTTFQTYSFDTVGLSTVMTVTGTVEFDNVKVSVIPEPATIGMLGLGAMLTFWIRRMRK